jgi:hypothetical protein
LEIFIATVRSILPPKARNIEAKLVITVSELCTCVIWMIFRLCCILISCGNKLEVCGLCKIFSTCCLQNVLQVFCTKLYGCCGQLGVDFSVPTCQADYLDGNDYQFLNQIVTRIYVISCLGLLMIEYNNS